MLGSFPRDEYLVQDVFATLGPALVLTEYGGQIHAGVTALPLLVQALGEVLLTDDALYLVHFVLDLVYHVDQQIGGFPLAGVVFDLVFGHLFNHIYSDVEEVVIDLLVVYLSPEVFKRIQTVHVEVLNTHLVYHSDEDAQQTLVVLRQTLPPECQHFLLLLVHQRFVP